MDPFWVSIFATNRAFPDYLLTSFYFSLQIKMVFFYISKPKTYRQIPLVFLWFDFVKVIGKWAGVLGLKHISNLQSAFVGSNAHQVFVGVTLSVSVHDDFLLEDALPRHRPGALPRAPLATLPELAHLPHRQEAHQVLRMVKLDAIPASKQPGKTHWEVRTVLFHFHEPKAVFF